MKVYILESAAHPTQVVFAWSIDHAAVLATSWHQMKGIEPSEFSIDPAWRKHIQKNQHAEVRESLLGEVAGIGEYQMGFGWVITTLDKVITPYAGPDV
ncbi:hypothetical protein [Sphingomonas mollis]|uniref:Uncharacterized protein n=1 Tax=Sphingomonas mollis TaxID=2795726 RepID=A0ABS0XSB2_9SPHN|nr:hypothetical protein [Sphingomonas sp. BT553]MBJ6122939.1 hypothetical protein [Sphingomonas sp. BT553]